MFCKVHACRSAFALNGQETGVHRQAHCNKFWMWQYHGFATASAIILHMFIWLLSCKSTELRATVCRCRAVSNAHAASICNKRRTHLRTFEYNVCVASKSYRIEMNWIFFIVGIFKNYCIYLLVCWVCCVCVCVPAITLMRFGRRKEGALNVNCDLHMDDSLDHRPMIIACHFIHDARACAAHNHRRENGFNLIRSHLIQIAPFAVELSPIARIRLWHYARG